MKKTLIALAGVALVAGCASPASYESHTPLASEVSQKVLERQSQTSVNAPVQRVTDSAAAYIPVVSRKVSENTWLRGQKVTVQMGKDPVPLSEVLRALSRQGVTITSELPLDRFQYSGFSLVDIDAESALRAIVTSVGLDFQADATRHLVVITPMSSRTWYLNMGNRHSSFASGGNTSADPSTTNAVAKAMGSGGGSNSSLSSGSSPSSGSGKSEVVSSDDFWPSLRSELDSRLKLMLPDITKTSASSAVTPIYPTGTGLPPLVPPLGSGAAVPGTASSLSSVSAVIPALPQAVASNGGLLNYVSKQVGTYALNPETGAVTIQAPHWILQDMDVYFKRVTAMYNTDLSFQGELILLTADATKSEGLDISSFAKRGARQTMTS